MKFTVFFPHNWLTKFHVFSATNWQNSHFIFHKWLINSTILFYQWVTKFFNLFFLPSIVWQKLQFYFRITLLFHDRLTKISLFQYPLKKNAVLFCNHFVKVAVWYHNLISWSFDKDHCLTLGSFDKNHSFICQK